MGYTVYMCIYHACLCTYHAYLCVRVCMHICHMHVCVYVCNLQTVYMPVICFGCSLFKNILFIAYLDTI